MTNLVKTTKHTKNIKVNQMKVIQTRRFIERDLENESNVQQQLNSDINPIQKVDLIFI